jgi:tetratricopeptide (TPR) repeat protein
MQQSDEQLFFKQFFSSFTIIKAIHFIILIGIIIFFNVLFNGFAGDDQTQVVQNVAVHSVLNIPNFFFGSTGYNGDILNQQGLYYRPMMSLFYSILYMLGGGNAFLFHLFQVLLYIANTLIVFFIFKHFFKMQIAFIGALLFLLHPMNSETVSYIANVQDVLFFTFGSLAFYINLAMKEGNKKLISVSILLLLSLFSKETGVLFVFGIILYDVIMYKKGVRQLPIIVSVVLGLYIIFRFFIAHIYFNSASFAPISQLSFSHRLLTVPSVILYYFQTAFFPITPVISQEWLVTTQSINKFYSASVFDSIIFIVLISIGYFIFRRYKNQFRVYLLFTLLLLFGIFLHSQILFALDNTVADRWFYFSLFGLIGIICTVLQIMHNNNKSIKFVTISIVVILIIISLKTYFRNQDFYDSYTLYSHDVKYSTNSSLLNSGLGNELMMRGDYSDARKYLLRSVQLDPKGYINWTDLAVYYEHINQIKSANTAYLKAIMNTQYYLAYQDYASFLFLYSTPKQAEIFTKYTLGIFPTNGYLWQLLTIIEVDLGNKNDALEASKKAVYYYPTELTSTMYSRLSKNLSLKIKPIQTKQGRIIYVCPPQCQTQ